MFTHKLCEDNYFGWYSLTYFSQYLLKRYRFIYEECHFPAALYTRFNKMISVFSVITSLVPVLFVSKDYLL